MPCWCLATLNFLNQPTWGIRRIRRKRPLWKLVSRHSFVFVQSWAKVSAGFYPVRSLAVDAFDLVYCSLSVLRFVFVLDIICKSSSSSSSFCVQHVYSKVNVVVLIRAIVLEVPLMYGIVAVVTGPELTLVLALESVSLWVFRLTKSLL